MRPLRVAVQQNTSCPSFGHIRVPHLGTSEAPGSVQLCSVSRSFLTASETFCGVFSTVNGHKVAKRKKRLINALRRFYARELYIDARMLACENIMVHILNMFRGGSLFGEIVNFGAQLLLR